ncbi:hypothetical protein [Nocardioides sp.]|uniref:DUF6907 domain-containing protein n=1 Tax=Nocardioides sp. TaxID=35761 RepID=UPI00261F7351|nr:hypothetical protein [Nocardioides sp.]
MSDTFATPSPGDHAAPRPSWQHEPCPRWCTRVHHEQDHPEDRIHQSEADLLGVLLAAPPVPHQPRSWASAELVVRLGRHVGDPTTWVAIETTEGPAPRVVLPVDSARLLRRHLGRQLQLADLA